MTRHEQVKIDQLKTTRPWPEAERSLIKDLRTNGLSEPILIRAQGLIVLDGMRRLAAAKSLGWEEVPAIVSDDMFDLCVELGERHEGRQIDPARQLDLLPLLHSLLGTRAEQYVRSKRYIERFGTGHDLTRGVSQLLMAPAMGMSTGHYNALLTVWRAANSGNEVAQVEVERFRRGEVSPYSMCTVYDKARRAFGGDVVELADQRALIAGAVANATALTYALGKLGNPSRLTKDELEKFTKGLHDARRVITTTINALRKETEGRP